MKIIVAPRDLESVVAEELASRIDWREGRLFRVADEVACHFAQNIWLDAQEFRFESISQAANHLRGIQRNWWLHAGASTGRAKLIREKLPPLNPKRLPFGASAPTAPLGSWTLLDDKTMLYAARCTSPYADGEVEFEENKVDPPSRAYLKLWELFTLEGRRPEPGARVYDLGSSPGGWTWVLDQLGCEVTSVDKAPLAPSLKLSPRVRYLSESAFGLKPEGKIDWLFSDVICYPERLLNLVRSWEPHVANFVCTIKFQGPTNFATLDEFLKIEGSRVRHLFNNKHELTWIKLKPEA